jgi:cytosine/adenosine deaminase-related metal-dependent hydrolase
VPTLAGTRALDLRLDTLYSAFEMIQSGVTTVQHIHGWRPGPIEATRAEAEAILSAYDEIGMRASYCYAVRDQNRMVYADDRDFVAGLPAGLRERAGDFMGGLAIPLDDQLGLFRDLRGRWAGQRRLAIQLAPANLHWCSDEALGRIGDLSRSHGVPMHMHLLETRYQQEYARRRTGTTAVRHIERLGLLDGRMTLGHGVWVTSEDVEAIADAGAHVCHNCSSNLRLRSGIMPLGRYERAGVGVAIGIDEAGLNDDRDMLQEMRLVLRLHRAPGFDEDEVPTPAQVLRMATEHGAGTTAFGPLIGRIEVGRRADLVLLDWEEIAHPYLDAETPLVDAIVQRAKSGAVRTVVVDGEIVFDHGRFTRIDRDAVLAEIAALLGRPPTPEECQRRALSRELVPHVKRFFDAYLPDRQRQDA